MKRRASGGRPIRTAFGGLLAVVLVVVASVGAAATAQAASSSSDLAVSYPPDPIPVKPGAQTTFTLRVADVGKNPMTVTISARQVKLSANGQTQFMDAADPLFAGHTQIVPEQMRLKARQARDVTITVDVPANVGANDYFLGFLVSPVVNGAAVRAVNQVGALVVLDVPGPRETGLSASFVHLPHIVWSSSVSASVRARSTGVSTLQFTTTTLVSGHVAPRPPYIMEKAHLLPPGLTWDVPVHWSSWLGLGWYTVHTTLVYNVTPQRTGDVVISRTVIVIDPLWLLLPAGIVAIVGFFIWRRQRKRRRRTHRPPPKAAKAATG